MFQMLLRATFKHLILISRSLSVHLIASFLKFIFAFIQQSAGKKERIGYFLGQASTDSVLITKTRRHCWHLSRILVLFLWQKHSEWSMKGPEHKETLHTWPCGSGRKMFVSARNHSDPHALAEIQRPSVSCFTLRDCVCVCVPERACPYWTNGPYDPGLCSFTVFTLFHSVGFLEPVWSGWSCDEELLYKSTWLEPF